MALEAFVRRLRRDLPDAVVDLRLFGFEARGDAEPDSEIDLVVHPDDQYASLETRVVDIAFDVNLEFNALASLTVEQTVE